MKSIGILGGMGPEATAYIYMQMIRYCQEKYGAKLDQDFPPIVILSLPVPDVVELQNNEQEVLAALVTGMDNLKKAGASFAFIACNSMEKFIPALRERIELLSIVEETVLEVKSQGFKKIGLLATETTLASGRYQTVFESSAIKLLISKKQDVVTTAIREILEGKTQEPKQKLLAVIKELENSGADSIILACTDLPVVLNQKDVSIKLLDTAAIIGKAAIKKYYQRK